ncbi:MAG: PHP domain-containing protein, partial [Anaerolineales bacterium]
MSSLFEYVGNLHMHTPYSDGELYHEDIAQAALAAGLDFIVVTDHNVRVRGPEGYHVAANGRRVLVLIGEEVHDVTRPSQSNHMLVLGVQEGLAPLATDPQGLINAIA